MKKNIKNRAARRRKPPNPDRKKLINFRLPPDLLNELKDCTRFGRDKTYIVTEALKRHLPIIEEELKDRMKGMVQEFENPNTGNGKAIPKEAPPKPNIELKSGPVSSTVAAFLPTAAKKGASKVLNPDAKSEPSREADAPTARKSAPSRRTEPPSSDPQLPPTSVPT
jgi:hypothetical protein